MATSIGSTACWFVSAVLCLAAVPAGSKDTERGLASQHEAHRAGREPVRRIAFLLFSGVEILDLTGPLEVFSAAGAEDGRFELYMVAETPEPVSTQGGLRLVPTHTLETCPPPDVLVVPGGRTPLDRPRVIEWLAEASSNAEVTLSVCTGAFLLSRAGLLENLPATTHRSSVESLSLAVPSADVRDDRRFVDAGRIVTSAGVAAGMDGALHVVERLLGPSVAERVAASMQYRWDRGGAETPPEDGPTAVYSLLRTAQTEGPEAALAMWRALESPPTEQAVNHHAYLVLMRAADPRTALPIFELNAARFPRSANALDSLGEALERVGERERAVVASHDGLQLLEESHGMDPTLRAVLTDACTSRIERLRR